MPRFYRQSVYALGQYALTEFTDIDKIEETYKGE